jgi:hypothetical protein
MSITSYFSYKGPMKKSIIYSFLILFLILPHYIQSHDESPYYGKSLNQMKYIDPDLKNALDNSWWDSVKYSFFTLPSRSQRKRINNNIAILNERIIIIDGCIEKAQQKLSSLVGKDYTLRGNDSTDLAVNIIFMPWILLFGYKKQQEINQLKKEIDTMLEAKKEIIKVVDKLKGIL